MASNTEPTAFTGRSRRKRTPWKVRAADVFAKWSITVGGIGTIVAVSLVFLFLFAVAVPLFFPARISRERRLAVEGSENPVLAIDIDEFQRMSWSLTSAGELRVIRLDNGRALFQRPLQAGVVPTAISRALASSQIALAAADGTLRFGTIGFASNVASTSKALPPEAQQLKVGEFIAFEEGVIERTAIAQWRVEKLEAALGNPVKVADNAVRLLDHYAATTSGPGGKSYLAAFQTDDGACRLAKIDEKENAITGETTLTSTVTPIPFQPRESAQLLRVLIVGRGDNVYLVWNDGWLQRFDIRNPNQIRLAEEVELLAQTGTRVTDCGFLLGRETLLVGDSQGGMRAWFRMRQSDAASSDGQRLAMVHDLSRGSSPLNVFSVSQRGRSFIAGYADGTIRMFFTTTEKLLVERRIAPGTPIQRVAIAPKEDGLVALTEKEMWIADLEPRHPEATLGSLFGRVWYEGYDHPIHMWQSSYSTAAPEMKLGLVPLIFGTLKATFYTMLFAAPLALLAAIYTSEFMHPRTRAWVKPTIEMMASLPSVVLGFLAALVFAPIIESHVTAAMSSLFATPFFFLLGAHLWQALPQRLLLRWQRYRLLLLIIALPLGIVASLASERTIERWLFAGDVMRWLDGQIGSGIGGWLLMWIPLSAVMTMMLLTAKINPAIRGVVDRCSRGQYVLLSLAKFLLATAFTLGIAGIISWLLDASGWDPRGSYVSTYVQRNALLVGIVMGFAVIPIIYTLADDALSTVPQHLRSASLGCGATSWQTAVRVVVPTAMSGLFSALMVGLGRAVGETMTVLMAGGNYPVIEWNIFSGYRTLSGNLATELPEAVRDSTHYRTLFLAALTLFVLTFCLNTVAELVRSRFRQRAYQL